MRNLATRCTLSYLRFLARLALKLHKPYIIGIAGSVGKSSARNALYSILKDVAPTRVVGNSETGIPLGILGITPQGYSKKDWGRMLLRAPLGLNYLKNTTYLIAEMGIDEPYPPKNMEYLLTICQPRISIDLNAEATHTMQFEKLLTPEIRQQFPGEKEQLLYLRQKIADEDSKMFKHAETIIYNADDPLIVNTLKTNRRNGAKVSLKFGKDKTNTASYEQYDIDLNGTKITLNFTDKKKLALFFPFLLPKVYEQTLAAVSLAAITLGIPLEKIKTSLETNFVLPKSRSNLLSGIRDSIIIDSSYNASKTATIAFLDLVLELKAKSARQVVFLFGDMRELGKGARMEHREVAERLVGIVDYLYLVGPLTREYVLPIIQEHESRFKEVRWFHSNKNAGEYLKDNLPKGAIVLVKGSQNTIFLEETVKYLLKNKADVSKLCRQEPYWLNLKKGV